MDANQAQVLKFKNDPDVNLRVVMASIFKKQILLYFLNWLTQQMRFYKQNVVLRMGQEKKCHIYYMITLNTVEHDVYFAHFSKKVE